MSILTRYLLRRNLFLLFAILLIGAGVYVLSDFFQRMDLLLDTGKGLPLIGLYYLFKLPLIVSQILPAVFLLAMVLQLLLMAKHRESIALQSGGVSPAAMIRFVLVYGLLWSCLQFAFSQVIGVHGEKLSNALWQESVRGRDQKNPSIEGVLFTKDNYVVQLGLAWPQQEKAERAHVYKLNDAGTDILASYSAASADSGPEGWTLYGVELIEPPSFSYSLHDSLELDIRQDLKAFLSYNPHNKSSEIEISLLASTIERLEQAGTNVEGLRTELYGRFSYAGSILVMGILALALAMFTDNIYVGVVLALVATFFFYTGGIFFSTLGQSGLLPPALAAWLVNIIFFSASLLFIFSSYLRALLRKK